MANAQPTPEEKKRTPARDSIGIMVHNIATQRLNDAERDRRRNENAPYDSKLHGEIIDGGGDYESLLHLSETNYSIGGKI